MTVFWVKESDYYDNPRLKIKKDWVIRIERELRRYAERDEAIYGKGWSK